MTDGGEKGGCRWRPVTRYLVLFTICFVTIMYSSNYAMPSSLETVFERYLKIGTYEFAYLFSSYTLASAFASVAGGVLTDRYLGVETGSLIFAFVGFLGQALVTCGAYVEDFSLVLVGRSLVGGGVESLAVLLNCYAVAWFDEDRLGFVFGFFLIFGKGVGTSLAFYTGSPLYEFVRSNFRESLILGATTTPYLFMTFLIILCTYFLGKISSFRNKKIVTDVRSRRNVSLKRIVDFPGRFWIFVLMLSFSSVSTTTLVPLSSKLLSLKYGLNADLANHYSTLFNGIVAVISPIPGLIAGRTGYYLYYDLAGTLLGVLSLIIFLTSRITPYIFIVLFAADFAIINGCSWNLVAIIVDEFQLASAYGTVVVTIHLLTSASNLVAGYLMQRNGDQAVAGLLLAYTSVGFLFTVLLFAVDRQRGGSLNLSASEREKRRERERRETELRDEHRS